MGKNINHERTLDFNILIDNLKFLFPENSEGNELRNGLQIIQEWRNGAVHSAIIPEHDDEKHTKVSKTICYLKNLARKEFKKYI